MVGIGPLLISSEQASCDAQVAIDKGLFRTALNPKAQPCLETILQTALEVAEGLAFLHSRCVVHCDLSGGGHSSTPAHGLHSLETAKLC